MRLHAWYLTDTGLRRDHNEDSFVARPEVGLFAVADGMGGHQAGDRASQLAIATLEKEVSDAAVDFDAAASRLVEESKERWFALANELAGEQTAELGDAEAATREVDSNEVIIAQPVRAVVRLAARKASAAVFAESIKDPSARGMGTTLTALLIDGGRAYVVHVGDSRAYLFRDGVLKQLTEDHTLIAEQLKAGLVSEREAAESRYKHVITRSIGFEADAVLDSDEFVVETGDCFVLCSDGLSNYVANDELELLLRTSFYRRLPDDLVALANERGGDDNITVVLVYVANSVVNGKAVARADQDEGDG